MQPTFIGKLIILPFAGHFYFMKKEIWKDVVGFYGIYKVSNMGAVKSLKRDVYNKNGYFHCAKKEFFMKIKTKSNEKGYFYIGLRKNMVSKPYFIHRLVAEAFN